jgi:predicted MFS family arabinose efflux permease
MPRALWALMVGNFVIGTGVMVVPGHPERHQRLARRDHSAGWQLITAAAILMGLGAPLFATLVAGWDRRRLLTYAAVVRRAAWACALAPSYAALLPLRVLAVMAPAMFTPQAAASVGLLVGPISAAGPSPSCSSAGRWPRSWACRCRPGSAANWAGAGPSGWWRCWHWPAQPGCGATCPTASAGRPVARGLGPARWVRPALMMAVGVTLLSAFGQFTLFSYFAPYFAQTLGPAGRSCRCCFCGSAPSACWATWP